MKKQKRIIQTLQKHASELKKRYKIRRLDLFGSYMRGDFNAKSDVDLLVEFSKTPDLFQFGEMEDNLSQLLGVKVDLVMRDVLKPFIGKEILKKTLPIIGI